MQLSKKHRFGIITFLILIVASYLVTKEPWKSSSGKLITSMPETPAVEIRIEWIDLATGYPTAFTADIIRSYTGFDLGYNEEYEQASWVAYVLTGEEIELGRTQRSDNFRADTSIETGSSSPEDYYGSGFDRGHLAPAGDMKWDPVAMSESFLMSNMSPQMPSFNRGIWRSLETQVREWALEKDSLYVISGPVLESIDSTIGENEVGVPKYYFKVVVDLSPPVHSMIAFLIPNMGSSSELTQFAISVDSLEKYTGYDFFASAPDPEVIAWLEMQLELDRWD